MCKLHENRKRKSVSAYEKLSPLPINTYTVQKMAYYSKRY